MSKAELMEQARALSEDERLFLSAYLKHLSRVDSLEYRRKLSDLKEECSSGKTFSQEEVERLHQQLSDEGR